jgi:hypothetical protein
MYHIFAKDLLPPKAFCKQFSSKNMNQRPVSRVFVETVVNATTKIKSRGHFRDVHGKFYQIVFGGPVLSVYSEETLRFPPTWLRIVSTRMSIT